MASDVRRVEGVSLNDMGLDDEDQVVSPVRPIRFSPGEEEEMWENANQVDNPGVGGALMKRRKLILELLPIKHPLKEGNTMMKSNEPLELRIAGRITLGCTKMKWIWSVGINICLINCQQ